MSLDHDAAAPAIQLRVADGARAPDLAAVHRQAFDRPWTALELQHLIDSPCTFALEAVPQVWLAAPLGFIVVRAVAGEAEILTLAVHPEARRRGLGRALVQGAATTAEELGAQALWLEVAVDNMAAIALYGATGFQAAGKRPRYYTRTPSERVDALVMRRLLNSATG